MSGGASSIDILQTMQQRLLNTADANSHTLAQTLGTRLYIVDVPSDATFPYGVMRLQNRRSGGWQLTMREEAELEVLFYARPFSALSAIEIAADLADGAMYLYQDRSGGGIVSCNRHRRDSIERFTDPADRELAIVRSVYSLILWPEYLTAHPTT